MDLMARYPDNYFNLAVVDPPYGIGEDWKKRTRTNRFVDTSYKNNLRVDERYFSELKRVAKNYIFWGYNYYTEFLKSTNYLICWDKGCGDNWVVNYSQFELACTNIKKPAKMFRHDWDGYRRGKETGVEKIHPHQKPILLYEWLLERYAEENDKILDTHLGSGSIALACIRSNKNLQLVGCEKERVYFEAIVERIKDMPISKKGEFYAKSQ